MKPTYNSVDWIDYLRVVYQKSFRIILISFVVAVLTAGITLLIDDQYKSTANILPNDKRSIGLGLLHGEGAGGISSIASSVLGGGKPQIINRFYVLLQSNTTRQKVVDRFNLVEHYGTSGATYPEKTAKDILAERSSFQGKEEGNFLIEVWDKSPEMAQNIAEYYVKRLNKLNNEISTKEATEYRKFIEDRYIEAQNDLDSLRKEMTQFQEKYGVYQLPQQVSGYFSLLASVTQKKIESEIKLELLDKTVKPNSNAYQQSLKQYETINSKLEELYHDQEGQNVILNFDKLPQVGARYFNLMRQLEVQEQIQKTIVPLYEQAKMEEAQALPLVTVVDAPRLPKKDDWPPRAIIVILSAITAGILCLLYYLIILSMRENRNYLEYLSE